MTRILCVFCGLWYVVPTYRVQLPHLGCCGATLCVMERNVHAACQEKYTLAHLALYAS